MDGSKQAVRKQMLNARKALDGSIISEKSRLIIKRLKATDEYRKTECIYAYMSVRGEVDLRELITEAWTEHKRVAVPRVCGRDMIFYYINDFSDLTEGSYHIQEPKEGLLKAEEENALLLIPGVAFDLGRNRIGYGGGFYDRYLEIHKNHYVAAPAYDFQVLAGIPHEEFDICVNRIITETRII